MLSIQFPTNLSSQTVLSWKSIEEQAIEDDKLRKKGGYRVPAARMVPIKNYPLNLKRTLEKERLITPGKLNENNP